MPFHNILGWVGIIELLVALFFLLRCTGSKDDTEQLFVGDEPIGERTKDRQSYHFYDEGIPR